ncbi:MAG: hypothetical protein ABIU05_16800 [Nitrospirales bacterium]
MGRLLVTLMGLLIVSCDWIESNEAHYPDMKAAAAAGEISRGWIPAFAPEFAADVRLKYDVENNRTWLSFRGTIDRATLPATCLSVNNKEITYPTNGPRGWWPVGLTAGSRDIAAEYEYYACKGGEVLAIDRAKTQVFLWRLAR